jgi:hypothetical protein
MRDEFNFEQIQSVEFCVNLGANGNVHTNYLIPADQTVQDALEQVLSATLADIEPEDGDWVSYELSEKYAPRESLRIELGAEYMGPISALYNEEGWDINARALQDPARLVYYFGVFRDDEGRKLIGVRQATQFKGAVKGRFLSVIDDTLKMVADRVFKLDSHFDFLITSQHAYVLHPVGFERVAEVEAFASARARDMTLALGTTVTFIDFAGLAAHVARHKRAAKLVAALSGRGDLRAIRRAKFCRAAQETGVELTNAGGKLAPARGSEIGCLELLDHRRYTTALGPGTKPAFVATSRRPV